MVLAVIIPIFILLCLGYLSLRLRLLNQIQIAAIGTFVIKIALPALFFQSLAAKKLDEIWFAEYFIVYASITFILYGSAYWLVLKYFQYNRSETSVFSLGAAMSNTGLIGTAVLTLLMGEKAMMYTSLVVIIESVLLLPLVLILAEVGMQTKMPVAMIIKNTLLMLVKNPLFMAVVLGMSCSVLQLTIPHYLDDVLKLLGQAASPLALFAIGGGMVGMTLKYVNLASCYIVFSSNILMPLLVFLGLSYLTDVDQEMIYAGTIIAALPMPTLFAILGQVYGLNARALTPLLMSTILGFTVISGLITLWWT
ncbi:MULTISPECIES: AEC family transporter [unclassified Acinetobacter]|uniref:AEC family transporter n=1 Tax=unclassified Acinetobacter TaxID=196816 RepID=UPI00293490D2|nr:MULTISPECIES: AEC family transporter [unclassified Acinetobacter]WOE33027.1 AEC family transporter [Acinetobacter sp. SAAs470]WOE38505.1 AEC family transporter [Acinetobacter sp. SAAs474]